MEGISIPAHPTIRQRIKCAGAKYCAPTRWCIPSWQRLYHSHTPPPASFAIHGSSASHSRSFFFGGADFFSAKLLFFRAARDVSGAHSETPWARVEIKLKTCFWLYPTRRPTIGRQPSHPRPPTFYSLPYHKNHSTNPQTLPSHPKIGTFPIGLAFSAHHP